MFHVFLRMNKKHCFKHNLKLFEVNFFNALQSWLFLSTNHVNRIWSGEYRVSHTRLMKKKIAFSVQTIFKFCWNLPLVSCTRRVLPPPANRRARWGTSEGEWRGTGPGPWSSCPRRTRRDGWKHSLCLRPKLHLLESEKFFEIRHSLIKKEEKNEICFHNDLKSFCDIMWRFCDIGQSWSESSPKSSWI